MTRSAGLRKVRSGGRKMDEANDELEKIETMFDSKGEDEQDPEGEKGCFMGCKHVPSSEGDED